MFSIKFSSKKLIELQNSIKGRFFSHLGESMHFQKCRSNEKKIHHIQISKWTGCYKFFSSDLSIIEFSIDFNFQLSKINNLSSTPKKFKVSYINSFLALCLFHYLIYYNIHVNYDLYILLTC